ncbi:hypothetical protein E2C01_074319 [Portunus trituberculatus]|uniref:Uncharacterized protein n=1 Tax=Portunus trituberculatus TaxID=210409 RepID=A0A5B7IBU7_PORTR|nr:hypothetical protein [Portunus trituberculatus]
MEHSNTQQVLFSRRSVEERQTPKDLTHNEDTTHGAQQERQTPAKWQLFEDLRRKLRGVELKRTSQQDQTGGHGQVWRQGSKKKLEQRQEQQMPK